MGLFKPKKYNPFLQQLGQSLMAGGAAQPVTGRGSALSNALQQIMGGILAGGQGRAETRGREETQAAIAAAQGMKPEITGAVAGPSLPGMPGILSGTPTIPVKQESKAAFAKRQGAAYQKALLESQIPEYQKMGEEMLMSSLTKASPKYQFMKGAKNAIFAFDPTDPSTALQVTAAEAGKQAITEHDPTKWHRIVDENGNVKDIIPPTADPDAEWGPTETRDDGFMYQRDNSTGKWHNTGIKPKDEASLVTVSMGGEGAPPTPGALKEAWTMYTKTGDRLDQMYQIREDYEAEGAWEDFTWTEQFANKYEGVRAKLGKYGEYLPELKPGEKVSAMAYRQAQVASVANQMIRDLTGAQMTVQEVPRLLRGIMNPDDNPITAKAKMNFVIQDLERVHAKYKEMLDSDQVRLMKQAGMDEAKIQEWIQTRAMAEVQGMIDMFDSMNWKAYSMAPQHSASPTATPTATPGASAVPTPTPDLGSTIRKR
jgi:hypothetical protein